MSIRKNPVAYLALFVALGGSAYAATNLPRNSVGSSQIRNGAVTVAKIRRHAVMAAALASNSVGSDAVQSGAVTGAKIAPHSLTGSVFAPGTIPAAAATPKLQTTIASVVYGPPAGYGPPPTVGQTEMVQASCPTGEEVVGGGFQVPSDAQSAVTVTASMPLTAPGGSTAYSWGVTYTVDQAGGPLDVSPYAVCAALR
jgi:hypothetical protein